MLGQILGNAQVQQLKMRAHYYQMVYDPRMQRQCET